LRHLQSIHKIEGGKEGMLNDSPPMLRWMLKQQSEALSILNEEYVWNRIDFLKRIGSQKKYFEEEKKK